MLHKIFSILENLQATAYVQVEKAWCSGKSVK
jgi:hypothetical protein